MDDLLLGLEKIIAQKLGYAWAIRFEDILKVIAGFILGGFYVIYRGARILLNFKQKNNLEDGEVLFLKAKKNETWANAKTLSGAFYAIFTMVVFHLRRRHFLRSKRIIHLFSIAVMVFCVIILYITAIYTITVFAADPLSSGGCKKTSSHASVVQHPPK